MTKKIKFNSEIFQIGKVIEEGKSGWVDVDINSALNADNSSDQSELTAERPNNRALSSLIVRYEILKDNEDKNTVSATLGEDFTAPQALITTTRFDKLPIIVVPLQDGKGRLYISALKDAISEKNEEITIRLVPDKIIVDNEEKDDSQEFQFYSHSTEEVKLEIKDDNTFSPGIFLTPAGAPNPRPLHITTTSKQVFLDLHLTSKPSNNVKILPTSGSLSRQSIKLLVQEDDRAQLIDINQDGFKISKENWDNPVRLIIETDSKFNKPIDLFLKTRSLDRNYNNKLLKQKISVSEDGFVKLSGHTQTVVVREDATFDAKPEKPLLSIEVIGGTEGVNTPKVRISSDSAVTEDTTAYFKYKTSIVDQEQKRTRTKIYKAFIKEGQSYATIYPPINFDNQRQENTTIEATLQPNKKYKINAGKSSDEYVDNDVSGISVSSVIDKSEVILVEELQPQSGTDKNSLLASFSFFGVHNHDKYDYDSDYGEPSDQTFELKKGYVLNLEKDGQPFKITLKNDAKILHYTKERNVRDHLIPVTIDNPSVVYGTDQQAEIIDRQQTGTNLLSSSLTATAGFEETSYPSDNVIPMDAIKATDGRKEIKIALKSKPTSDVKVTIPNRLHSKRAYLLLDNSTGKESVDLKGPESSNLVEFTFTPKNWDKQQSIYVGQELIDNDRYYEGNWNIPLISSSSDKKFNETKSIRINSVFTPEEDVLEWKERAEGPLVDVRVAASANNEALIKQKEGSTKFEKFEVHLPFQRAAERDYRIVIKTDEVDKDKNLHPARLPRIRSESQLNGILLSTYNQGNTRKAESNLNWGIDSLSTKKEDDWAVEGQGFIEIPESGYYIFAYDVANGSFKLRVNNQLIANTNHSIKGHFKSDPYYFDAGTLIPIQIIYETTGRNSKVNAGFEIGWGSDRQSPSNIQSFEPIEISQLYKSREEANSVVIKEGNRSEEFYVESYDDNINQGDFKYDIKIIENAHKVKTNKDGIPRSAKSAYQAPDYSIDIKIENIEILENFKGQKVDKDARTYIANLTANSSIEYSDYKLDKLTRIPIIDSDKTDEQLFFDLADDLDLGALGRSETFNKGKVRLIANYELDQRIINQGISTLSTKLPISSPLKIKISDDEQSGYEILDSQFQPLESSVDLFEDEFDQSTDFYVRLRTEPTNFVKLIGELDTDFVHVSSDDAFKLSNEIGRVEFNFNQDNYYKPQKFSITPVDDLRKINQINTSLISFTSQSLDRKYNETNLLGVGGEELETFCPEEGCSPDRWTRDGVGGKTPPIKAVRKELRQLERLSGDNHYIVPSNQPIKLKIKDNDKPSVDIRSSNNGQIIEDENDAYYAVKLGTKPKQDVTINFTPPEETNLLLSLANINHGTDQSSTQISLRASRLDEWREDSESKKQKTTIIPAHSVLSFYDNKGHLVRFSNKKQILIKPENLDVTRPPEFDSDGEPISEEILIERGETIANIPVEMIVGESHLGKIKSSLNNSKLTAVNGFNSIYNTKPRFKLASQIIPELFQLTFTPEDWDQEQYVHINPYDDRTFNGDVVQPINVSVNSNDRQYAKLDDNSINVEIIDDDLPVASLSVLTDGTEHAEPGRFRVELDSNPDVSANSKGIEVHYEIKIKHVDKNIPYGDENGEVIKGDDRLSSIIQHPTRRGSVRIPPGQLYSDEIVVAIDDFDVQANYNKINISIIDDPQTSSKKAKLNLPNPKPTYQVTDEDNRQASMQFVDNDKAGVLLIFPGDQLVVAEGERGAQMFVMLTSQPRGDVSIDLKEKRNPLFDDRAQLADNLDPDLPPNKRPRLTFNPENWFIPQVFTIPAKLDTFVEDHHIKTDEYIYADTQQSIFKDEDDDAVSNYLVLRQAVDDGTFEDLIVSEGVISNTGRHKAQLELSIDGDGQAYDDDVIGDPVLDVIVIDAQLPDNFIDNIDASLAGIEGLVTSIDYPLFGKLDSDDLNETFNIMNDFRSAYEGSPNSTLLTVSDAFENAHGDNLPESLNAGESKMPSGKYRSEGNIINYPFKIIVNEHVDSLTVEGLNLGGNGSRLLMNPKGLQFSNPNDPKNDSITLETDRRIQPVSFREDNNIVYSNYKFTVPLNRTDRIRLTSLIRRVRDGEKKTIQVSRNTDTQSSLITSNTEVSVVEAINSWPSEHQLTIVNRPTIGWDMEPDFKVTSKMTTTSSGQVVLNANVTWNAKQQIAALPLDFRHNEGGGSEGGMTFASKSDLGIDTFLNLEIALDLNFPIADLSGNGNAPSSGGSVSQTTGSTSPGLGSVNQVSSSSDPDIPTSKAIRKFKNAKSRQIDQIIKHYSNPSGPDYMVPGAIMNALQSLQNIGSQGWINTENSGIKFNISSEPTGSFLASLNGATVRFNNVPCTTEHCVKKLADGDAEGISTKLELSAFARPKEQAAGTNRLDLTQITQRGFRDSFSMGVTLDSALSVVTSLGIQTADELATNALAGGSWWPSFDFGLAHKFPDAIQGARNSFSSGNTKEQDLPSTINSGEPEVAQEPSSPDTGPQSLVRGTGGLGPVDQVSSSLEPGPQSLDIENASTRQTFNNLINTASSTARETYRSGTINNGGFENDDFDIDLTNSSSGGGIPPRRTNSNSSGNNSSNNNSNNNSNSPVLFGVNMKLGDFLTNAMNPTVRNIDDAIKDIYPVLDVLYGDIAFFRAFDRSIAQAMDTDSDGNVTIMDIVMNSARVAAKVGGAKGRGLCLAVQALNVLGSKLNQFSNLVRQMSDVSRQNEGLDRINQAFDFSILLEDNANTLRQNISNQAEVDLILRRKPANEGGLENKYFRNLNRFRSLQVPNGSFAGVLTKNEQEFVRQIEIKGFSEFDQSHLDQFDSNQLDSNQQLINSRFSLKGAEMLPLRKHYTWSSIAKILLDEFNRSELNSFSVGEFVGSQPQVVTRMFKDYDDLYLYLSDLMQAPNTPGQTSTQVIYNEIRARLQLSDEDDLDILLRENKYEYLDHILRDVRRTVETLQTKDSDNNSLTIHSIRDDLPGKISNEIEVNDFQRSSFKLQLLEEYVLGSAVSPVQTSSTPVQNVRNTSANIAGIRSLCDSQSIANDLKGVRPGVDFNQLAAFAGNPSFFSEDNSTESRLLSTQSSSEQSSLSSGPLARSSNPISNLGQRMMRVLEGANSAGFYFPLFQDKQALIDIILGGSDVDLMTYTLPTLQAEAGIDISKPLGAVRPRLSGSLGLYSRFGFGMDSSGFTRWRDAGSRSDNLEMIMDGFYIADRWSYNAAAGRWLANPFGRDMRELAIEGRIGVGLEGNLGVIRGNVEGGVFADVGFDFVDVGELQGKSDGRIRGYEMEKMFRNPTEAIAFGGGIHFFLQAAIQIGIDLGFINEWHDLWSAELARLTLAEFSTVDRSSSSAVGNDPYRNATVFFDTNTNYSPDSGEPTTNTTLDGSFSMEVDMNFFTEEDIKNGQLIAFAGVDTATNRLQSIPFTAPVGTPLTPLTTFRSLMISYFDELNSQQGSINIKAKKKGFESSEAVDEFIRRNFNIKNFDYTAIESTQFLATEKSLSNKVVRSAAYDYLAHIKLNFLYSAVENLLQHGLPDHFSNDLQSRFERISAISTHIFNDLSNGRDPLSKDHEYIARELLGVENLNNNFEETDKTTKFVASLVEQAAELSQSLWRKLDRRLEQSDSDSALDFVSEILPIKRQYFDDLNLLSSNISLIDERFKSDLINRNPVFALREPRDFVGTSNDDFLSRFDSKSRIYGDDGNDLLLGGHRNDNLWGENGSDYLIGGPKSDLLRGGNGDDTLTGNEGSDSLNGGPGDDRLDGGQSDDTLQGASGADTYVYTGGHDVLIGFSFGNNQSLDFISDKLETKYNVSDAEISRPTLDTSSRHTILLSFNDRDSLQFNNVGTSIYNKNDKELLDILNNSMA
ncbi:PA14 domain-containing protein [Synechococcus sp. CC9616]|uniref:PA14 domain-containing protein n=1 Tax=Synechococcus sp. CC9616 TaxID=110663 RepID=UPI0004AF529B|nr:PA14 domain-containing protein [Synechococcus sp. CC9616]